MSSHFEYLILSIQSPWLQALPHVMIRGKKDTPEEALEKARDLQLCIDSEDMMSIQIHRLRVNSGITSADYAAKGEKAIIVYHAERMGAKGAPRYEFWKEAFHGSFGEYELFPLERDGQCIADPQSFAVVAWVDTEPKFAGQVPDMASAIRLMGLIRALHSKVHIYDDTGCVIEKKTPVLAGSN